MASGVSQSVRDKLAAATDKIMAQKANGTYNPTPNVAPKAPAASTPSYSVDTKGNVFKNGNFVPAENLKYIPSDITSQAKANKTTPGIAPADAFTVTPELRAAFDAKRAQNSAPSQPPQDAPVSSAPVYSAPAQVYSAPAIQPASTPQPAAYQSTYTGPDIVGMTQQIKDIFGNRQASELQKLRQARDVALQGYNSQETLAKQNAYDNRNQADVTNLQNQQRMRETMANAGLTTDGQNLTLQAAQNAQRLGALGDINRQEANNLQDIGQQRALLQNNAANNELALTQQINSDQANALYDLMKYGDTRAFNVDQSNYGRYQDSINNQFRNDQFDWQKQTDLANLLGSINGQQTLASRAQDFGQQMDLANLLGTYQGQSTLAGKNANLNAALQVGNATGRLVSPQADYSGLIRQAANPNTPLNMAGQNQQLNNTQTMAGLTGMMPDGKGGLVPTTAEQQRQLGNLWAVADQTGTIPNQLADMYGIPRGTQTQQAKQFAMNFGQQEDQNYISYINAANKGNDGGATQTVSSAAAADLLSQALRKQVGEDNGKPVYGTIQDPVSREKAFLNAWNQSGVSPGADTIEMLSKAGYSPDEIAKFKQKYPDAFNAGGVSSGSYAPEINASSAKWGVPTNLIEAVIDAESSGNHKAVSGAGAQGLMQLMPATARGLGVTNSFDPAQNIEGGTQYLKGLLDTYDGDYAKALAGYNAGGGRVKKAIAQYGNEWFAHMPDETQKYVRKIMSKLGG